MPRFLAHFSLVLFFAFNIAFPAFTDTEPDSGLRENPSTVNAWINAHIIVAPGEEIEYGTLVIRDGMIEAVGAKVSPPADARIW
ncbi:hypothetical protein K8I31_06570, partial [bacterium]|nr:hypothetical protein [bacterium]